jgi:hypothetical protein
MVIDDHLVLLVVITDAPPLLPTGPIGSDKKAANAGRRRSLMTRKCHALTLPVVLLCK